MKHFNSTVSAAHSDLTATCFESHDGWRIVTALIISTGESRTQVHMSPKHMRDLALALVSAAEKREMEESDRALYLATQSKP